MGTTPQNILTPIDTTNFVQPSETSDPGFTQYANDNLGDAASEADGFDDAVSEVLALMDLFDSGLAAIQGAAGGTLDDAFVEAFQIDAADVANDQGNFAAAYPAYEAATGDLGTLIASPQQTTPPATSGTVYTPEAAQNCGGSVSVLMFNLQASPTTQFIDLNINDPFDIGAHLTSIALAPTSDPPFFNLVGMASVYLQIGSPQKVGILNGVFANPGEYWCQINMTFDLDAHAGPGSLNLCVKVTVS